MPKTFKAAFPICGAGDTKSVTKYAKHTSVWIFHGAKDDVVMPECSRTMYNALKEAKASVFYTEYPEAGHNSWDSAFKEEQLMPWLFSR
jgi:predicted peptidase